MSLDHPPTLPAIVEAQERYHHDIVDEVRREIAAHDVVVVGMAWNQPVRHVRAALDEAGVAHHYVEFGNYTNQWRRRLALKLWTRWPTFPQVFVRGTFVGGNNDVRRMIADGTLAGLLTGAEGQGPVSESA